MDGGNSSKRESHGFGEFGKPINLAGEELKEWTCSPGHYQDGKITCRVPQLIAGEYDPDSALQYNVDVALNGQQFTGKPLLFRYYDI